MIRGHQSLLLKRLFSTSKDKNKKTIICSKFLNTDKISPTHCFISEKDKKIVHIKEKKRISIKLPPLPKFSSSS